MRQQTKSGAARLSGKKTRLDGKPKSGRILRHPKYAGIKKRTVQSAASVIPNRDGIYFSDKAMYNNSVFGLHLYAVGKWNTREAQYVMKIKLTVTESRCCCGYHQTGDTFIVEGLCPPICHEIWYAAYPFLYALLYGGTLDCGKEQARKFDVRCPDDGRVCLHGECLE